jgi:hypothetical protein
MLINANLRGGQEPGLVRSFEEISLGGEFPRPCNILKNIGHHFQTQKELRQRDPLFPILFNIVAYMLAALIDRVRTMVKLEVWYPTCGIYIL